MDDGAGQRREIHDHFSPFHARLHGNRIAAAALADRRNINRRAAIAADHVLPFLAVSGRAANLAGIERRGVIAVGLVDHQEADHRVVHVRGVEMQARNPAVRKAECAPDYSRATSILAGSGAFMARV